MANKLDGFMAAASQRLGEEDALNASRAASSGRRMELPGVGREQQAGLDELARSFVQGRDGMPLSAASDQRVNGRRRRPSGSVHGLRSGSGGDCRQSQRRTVSGRGRGAGWDWAGKKPLAITSHHCLS